MHGRRYRRWGVGLIAALMACGAFGAAPVRAQSVPIVVPPISSIVVGIPPAMPSLVFGASDDSGVHSQGGLTWSTTGRAGVDVDINSQQSQAEAS